MLRAFTTQENAGESFNATVTTRLANERWKPSPTWYATYGQTYLASLLNGSTVDAAHTLARSQSDIGRPAAGSDQFKQIFDAVRKVPISKGGGLFVDKSDLYQVEGQYNLTKALNNVAEVLVGGNFKRYVLNSEGTLFADTAGRIGINEMGGYVQVAKQIIDRVKLTVSGRYDKNQNFKGKFTPRATAVIKVAPNNNIRVSYQSAYRFPSTQQQWINLAVGSNTRLIGGVGGFINYFDLKNPSNPTFTVQSVLGGSPVAYGFPELKPESMNSIELGYKGLLAKGKVLVDAYVYSGVYKDFNSRIQVVKSATGSPAGLSNRANWLVYSVPSNNVGDVTSFGFGLGIDYRLPHNFTIGTNISSDEISEIPVGFTANFNSPKYRFNGNITNTGFGKKKRLGASIQYKWQDAFMYESDFVNSALPAVQLLDIQFSYKIPKTKSMIKVGGNNVLNQYYYNAAGNSQVGGLYYVSFGYNVY